MLDWTRVGALDWEARQAGVIGAARKCLLAVEVGQVLTTRDLATRLLGNDAGKAAMKVLLSDLGKVAKKMPVSFATHDGEVYTAYGRQNRRWRWHGQEI